MGDGPPSSHVEKGWLSGSVRIELDLDVAESNGRDDDLSFGARPLVLHGDACSLAQRDSERAVDAPAQHVGYDRRAVRDHPKDHLVDLWPAHKVVVERLVQK